MSIRRWNYNSTRCWVTRSGFIAYDAYNMIAKQKNEYYKKTLGQEGLGAAILQCWSSATYALINKLKALKTWETFASRRACRYHVRKGHPTPTDHIIFTYEPSRFVDHRHICLHRIEFFTKSRQWCRKQLERAFISCTGRLILFTRSSSFMELKPTILTILMQNGNHTFC